MNIDAYQKKQRELIAALQRLAKTADGQVLMEWLETEFDPDMILSTVELTAFRLGQRDVYRQIKRAIDHKGDDV